MPTIFETIALSDVIGRIEDFARLISESSGFTFTGFTVDAL